eukprot:jgi/Botrbrau1/10385/Bobra.146_2s0023.1
MTHCRLLSWLDDLDDSLQILGLVALHVLFAVSGDVPFLYCNLWTTRTWIITCRAGLCTQGTLRHSAGWGGVRRLGRSHCLDLAIRAAASAREVPHQDTPERETQLSERSAGTEFPRQDFASAPAPGMRPTAHDPIGQGQSYPLSCRTVLDGDKKPYPILSKNATLSYPIGEGH